LRFGRNGLDYDGFNKVAFKKIAFNNILDARRSICVTARS